MIVALKPSSEELMTVREAAKLLKLSEITVYRLLTRGELRGQKIHSRLWLISQSEILRYQPLARRPGRPPRNG